MPASPTPDIDLRRPLTVAGHPAELHVVGSLSASIGFVDDAAEPRVVDVEIDLPEDMLRQLERDLAAVLYAERTPLPAYREMIDMLEARP